MEVRSDKEDPTLGVGVEHEEGLEDEV